jgi:hypothetical protein
MQVCGQRAIAASMLTASSSISTQAFAGVEWGGRSRIRLPPAKCTSLRKAKIPRRKIQEISPIIEISNA